MDQPKERRYILNLLYANTINRGGSMNWLYGSSRPVEVVEELLPLNGVEASLSLPKTVKRVTLEPQGGELSFERGGDAIAQVRDRRARLQAAARTAALRAPPANADGILDLLG